MRKSADRISVEGQKKAARIKEWLREYEQLQDVARKSLCRTGAKLTGMPEFQNRRGIAVVERAVLHHEADRIATLLPAAAKYAGADFWIAANNADSAGILLTNTDCSWHDILLQSVPIASHVCGCRAPDGNNQDADGQNQALWCPWILPGTRKYRMTWTDRELSAWLDEMLPAERMAELEQLLRSDESLQARVAQLIHHRDQGGHSVGEIWQRAGLSCPSRSELSGYLLRTLSPDQNSYVEFHLMTVGCRICQANLKDLEEHANQSKEMSGRRRRFFESSAGLLNSSDSDQF